MFEKCGLGCLSMTGSFNSLTFVGMRSAEPGPWPVVKLKSCLW
jgi:hypothetical protein